MPFLWHSYTYTHDQAKIYQRAKAIEHIILPADMRPYPDYIKELCRRSSVTWQSV